MQVDTQREEWTGQLSTIITETLELEPGELTSEGDFVNDYGADSMLVIDILSRVEEDMGVRIPDTAIRRMTHLGAMVELVEEYSGSDA